MGNTLLKNTLDTKKDMSAQVKDALSSSRPDVLTINRTETDNVYELGNAIMDAINKNGGLVKLNEVIQESAKITNSSRNTLIESIDALKDAIETNKSSSIEIRDSIKHETLALVKDLKNSWVDITKAAPKDSTNSNFWDSSNKSADEIYAIGFKDTFKEIFKAQIFKDMDATLKQLVINNKTGDTQVTPEVIKSVLEQTLNILENQRKGIDVEGDSRFSNLNEINTVEISKVKELLKKFDVLDRLTSEQAPLEKDMKSLMQLESKYKKSLDQLATEIENTVGNVNNLNNNAISDAIKGIEVFTDSMLQASRALMRAKYTNSKVRNNPVAKSLGGMMYASNGAYAAKGVDTIPAMVTPGEFIINRKASSKFFSVLSSMNQGTNKIQPINNEYTQNIGDINVTVQGQDNPTGTAHEIASVLRREMSRGTIGRF
jgi:uncharacterized protein YukE